MSNQCPLLKMDAQTLLGINISKLRREAKVSQEELAARMNVDQAYISRLEAGDLNPTVQTVEAAAKALNAEISQLFLKP